MAIYNLNFLFENVIFISKIMHWYVFLLILIKEIKTKKTKLKIKNKVVDSLSAYIITKLGYLYLKKDYLDFI